MSENQTIEYKKIWRDEYLKWVCGITSIKYVIENGSINNSEVQKLLNVSKPTATRLLKQTESYLEKQGTRGMGTIYVLRGRLS